MSRETLKEKEFQTFKEMLESDPKLKEIVDSATAESTQRERRPLRIPYVSAPRLTENAWK